MRNGFVPGMTFFAHTRTRRNTAFAMLLVWLFAMASGIANACFLESPAPHAQAVEQAAATTSQAPAGMVALHGASANHHDDSDNAKESCLKVCDDGAQTVPKASSGIDHTDPGPAAWVATLWTASSPVVSAPRRVDDLAIAILGPPLRIRYSRLAL